MTKAWLGKRSKFGGLKIKSKSLPVVLWTNCWTHRLLTLTSLPVGFTKALLSHLMLLRKNIRSLLQCLLYSWLHTAWTPHDGDAGVYYSILLQIVCSNKFSIKQVSYVDGDEENLYLKNHRWAIIQNFSVRDKVRKCWLVWDSLA